MTTHVKDKSGSYFIKKVYTVTTQKMLAVWLRKPKKSYFFPVFEVVAQIQYSERYE